MTISAKNFTALLLVFFLFTAPSTTAEIQSDDLATSPVSFNETCPLYSIFFANCKPQLSSVYMAFSLVYLSFVAHWIFSPIISSMVSMIKDGIAGEDQISNLPDCLIVEILSRLPSTKDAIKTSTLSKRWEYLWTQVPTLSFTNTDSCNRKSRSGFFSLVDKTLTQCRQLKLKKFVVCTTYDARFEAQVNSWIRHALRCNAEELSFTLRIGNHEFEHPLDQTLFTSSCFTSLTLSGCRFKPVGAISWENLRSLCISNAVLDERLIENILSGSPLLETFELGRCIDYKLLNITSTSVKKLVISGYIDFTARVVEINAPNISSLTIQKSLAIGMILLLNVSSLIEANLNFEKARWGIEPKNTEEELKGLTLNLGHVKEVKIGELCSKAVSQLEAEGFVFPSNVKLVERSSYSVV